MGCIKGGSMSTLLITSGLTHKKMLQRVGKGYYMNFVS